MTQKLEIIKSKIGDINSIKITVSIGKMSESIDTDGGK
jgi:hypothetical protein